MIDDIKGVMMTNLPLSSISIMVDKSLMLVDDDFFVLAGEQVTTDSVPSLRRDIRQGGQSVQG